MKVVWIMGSRVGGMGMGLPLVNPVSEEEEEVMVGMVGVMEEAWSTKAGKAIRGRRLPIHVPARSEVGVVGNGDWAVRFSSSSMRLMRKWGLVRLAKSSFPLLDFSVS